MKKSALGLVVSIVVCGAALACSQAPQNLMSPSATTGGSATAASDGSTLKVSAPPIVEPTDSHTADSRNPTLIWANSTGTYGGSSLEYEIELYDAAQRLVYGTVAGETPNTGSHRVPVELSVDASYNWRIRARFTSMTGPWSGYAEFRTPKPAAVAPPTTGGGSGVTPGNGFRTPDPPPGQRLPRPNHQGNVQAFANLNPSFLRNSCQLEGGNWNFMDGAVDTLQAIDLRYGYNCKRGNCNDPSLDVVSYHWGAGPDEGSSDVYCTDLISGHCGPTPGVIWNDVTGITLDSGTVCRVIFTRPGRKR